MKSNQFFDFTRFINTLKTDLLPKRRALLIASLAAMGVMLLLTFFGVFSDFRINNISPEKTHMFFSGVFPGMLVIAGLFITAATFRPLADSRIAHGYLGLPASHFEKYLSKWLLTGPVYLIAGMALIAITAVVAKVILAVYPGTSINLAETLKGLRLGNIGDYLFIHSIFLLGAIAFKRLAFWKTLLTMFATLMTWAMFTGLSFRLIFAKYFTGSSMTIDDSNFDFNLTPEFLNFGPEQGWWIAGVISLLVWATFNTAAYFKLKETEV